MKEDKFGSAEMFYDRVIESIKNNPRKTVAIAALAILVAAVLGFATASGGAILTFFIGESPSATTTPSLTNSNYAVGISGSVTQTIIGTVREPRLQSSVISPPMKQEDGLYHTSYQLKFEDGSEKTAPNTFRYEFFLKCLETKNPQIQIRPFSALINDIECLSITPPSLDQELFHFN